ncbi:MAG: hypothetical protein DDT26_00326 [Dehalococcoidia bacterium]|nr:hypothetical protein [Chloroflexota bacterium]
MKTYTEFVKHGTPLEGVRGELGVSNPVRVRKGWGQLRVLMKSSLSAEEAMKGLSTIMLDGKLFDQLQHLVDTDAKGDVRPYIKKRLRELGFAGDI